MVFLVMAIGIFEFAYTTEAQEISVESLLVQIQELQKQVLELQKQISQLQTATFFFSQNLSVGVRDDAVGNLQRALTDEGIYSGPITGYFGSLTKAAVIKFQEKYADEILKPLGLARGTGFFGPRSREKLNAILGINFTVNGEKEIEVFNGSPVTISWNMEGVDPDNALPCRAMINTVRLNGNLYLLQGLSWNGPKPATGDEDILAYAGVSGDFQDRLILSLTCLMASGFEVSDEVQVTTVRVSGNMIVRTTINGSDNGEGEEDIPLSQIGEELKMTWGVSGGAQPVSCYITDFGNKVLRQNLSTSGSYTVTNPKIEEAYYVNCMDGNGYYAWDGVEIIE